MRKIFSKWRIRIILLLFGLLPILGGCQGCSTAPEPSPAAPSDLTATAVSSNQINLTWKDNSNNEKGFYVYRKTTGNYKRVEKINANVTSCSNTGLTEGTTYYYQVTAYHDDGESERSNEAQATTLQRIEILDYSFSSEYNEYLEVWITEIEGHAKNNTDKTFSYVSISARLYDTNDILQDTTFTNITDFPPGDIWHFEMIPSWTDIRIIKIEIWVDTIWE